MRCATVRPAKIIVLALALLCAAQAEGQFTTVINVPPDLELDRLEPGTQVNVFAGGVLSTSGFQIDVDDAELNIAAATVDEVLRATGGATINVENGYVKSARVVNGSRMTVETSTTGRLSAEAGGQIIVDGSDISSLLVGTLPPPRGLSDDDGSLSHVAVGKITDSRIGFLDVQRVGYAELRDSSLDVGLSVDGGGRLVTHNSQLAVAHVGRFTVNHLTADVSHAEFHSSQATLLQVGSLGIVTTHGTDIATRVELSDGGTLNHFGGSIAQLFVTRWGDRGSRKSVANIYGGYVGQWSEVNQAGIVNIYGGGFDSRLRIHGGAMHFYGGTIGDAFYVGAEGSLHWHGGDFTGRTSFGDADVFIYGTRFEIVDQESITPITHFVPAVPTRFGQNNLTLRVHRLDGTVYDAKLSDEWLPGLIHVTNDARVYLVLVQVPEPATLTLALLPLGGYLFYRRRLLTL